MYEFDHASGSSGLESSIRKRRAGRDAWPFPGRHESHAEIQDETPIFHALTVGEWRERQRSGRAGNAVRRVHRGTLRSTRKGAETRQTADAVAAFHPDPLASPVPAQSEPAAAGFHGPEAHSPDVHSPDFHSETGDEMGDGAMAMLRRRRDAGRAADRAAIADLLGGAGRHRLPHSA